MISIFSQRLKELREQREWTQEYLGSLVNVSDVTINRYEKDNRKPDQKLLRSLADIFDVSIDYLLGRTDVNQIFTRQNGSSCDPSKEIIPEATLVTDGLSAEKIMLAKRINNLSEDNQKTVEKIIGSLELQEQIKEEKEGTDKGR